MMVLVVQDMWQDCSPGPGQKAVTVTTLFEALGPYLEPQSMSNNCFVVFLQVWAISWHTFGSYLHLQKPAVSIVFYIGLCKKIACKNDGFGTQR